jgi:SAM-dependent methyltransferase
MTGFDGWLAAMAKRWLHGFMGRHGLTEQGSGAPLLIDTQDSSPLLLHVGCGPSTLAHIPVATFRDQGWRELRLDVDVSVQPDIHGSMTDMVAVPSGLVDAVYSSHSIEHLVWHDVPKALAEFLRVLKETGFAVITCPDLQALASMVEQDRLLEPLYESFAGPVSAFDILFGYRPLLEQNPWMAHRSGFTFSTLVGVLRQAGFASVAGFRRPEVFDLWVVASKSSRTEVEMHELARLYLVQSA